MKFKFCFNEVMFYEVKFHVDFFSLYKCFVPLFIFLNNKNNNKKKMFKNAKILSQSLLLINVLIILKI